jgi:AcrR family transcriptional regulator
VAVVGADAGAGSGADATLTSERVLEAAEEVLRRYGPGKATVVDVARALGVSHGSVYRHFPSKRALRDGVTERWLARISAPLEVVAAGERDSALERLRRWLELLIMTKRGLALDDPELFATYHTLAADSRWVVVAHVDTLTDQLRRIIADGVDRAELSADDPAAAARAVFNATSRFHNPAHAAEWSDPAIDDAFDEVWALIVNGLARRPPA